MTGALLPLLCGADKAEGVWRGADEECVGAQRILTRATKPVKVNAVPQPSTREQPRGPPNPIAAPSTLNQNPETRKRSFFLPALSPFALSLFPSLPLSLAASFPLANYPEPMALRVFDVAKSQPMALRVLTLVGTQAYSSSRELTKTRRNLFSWTSQPSLPTRARPTSGLRRTLESFFPETRRSATRDAQSLHSEPPTLHPSPGTASPEPQASSALSAPDRLLLEPLHLLAAVNSRRAHGCTGLTKCVCVCVVGAASRGGCG
eukprot:2637530-Rhodomonas_salina.3